MTLASDWKARIQSENRRAAKVHRGVKQRYAENRANEIIRAIPKRLKGKRGPVAVMELEPDEYSGSSFRQPVPLNTLGGAARLVARYCRDQGLYVYICGDGMDERKPPVEMMVLPENPDKS